MLQLIDFWRYYGPVVLHVIFPFIVALSALVCTVAVFVYRRRRVPDSWSVVDDEVDGFLDWRDKEAWKDAEASARADAQCIECSECGIEYLCIEGHECEPLPQSFRIVELPPDAPITTRAVKEPLFDREIVSSSFSFWEVRFFTNCYSFQDGGSKSKSDTNLYGPGGCLPMGMEHYVYKVSLQADDSMPDEDYSKLYDRGFVEWRMAQTIFAAWPCRAIMLAPGERRNKSQIGNLDITVSGKPYVLRSQECFDIRLSCPEPMSKKSGVMFFLWGIQKKALCG